MWKNEKFFLTKKIFRQINSLVTYLVKLLLSRNFYQNCVRENFRNFHTVQHCARTVIISQIYPTSKIPWIWILYNNAIPISGKANLSLPDQMTEISSFGIEARRTSSKSSRVTIPLSIAYNLIRQLVFLPRPGSIPMFEYGHQFPKTSITKEWSRILRRRRRPINGGWTLTLLNRFLWTWDIGSVIWGIMMTIMTKMTLKMSQVDVQQVKKEFLKWFLIRVRIFLLYLF